MAVVAVWLIFVGTGLSAADESESSVPDSVVAAVPAPAALELGECPVAPMSGPRLTLAELLEWAPCPL